MSEQQAEQTLGHWLWTTLAWDGCLPLVAASSRAFLPWLLADKDLAMMIAVFIVPFVTALVRAHRGKRQLESFVGRAGVWRQMVLAAAILALVVFEAVMALLIGEGRAGVDEWCAAALVYLVYFILVALAVWPPRIAVE
ncbi:MAG TPA: hypothetical protein VGG30_11225 [Pirellulales bacterium]|jgi:hypothetical protein